MSSYLAINVFIVLIPLLLSFEKNVLFYKKLKNVFISIIAVGIIFLIWDVIATENGDWSFNSEYTGSVRIYGLPVEEILFFITVPYSILFVFESLTFYIKEKKFEFNRKYFLIVFMILFFAAITNIDKNYTSAVFFICSVLFLLSSFYDLKVYNSLVSILTILVSFIPFFIVNYILTSLPVVEYNPEAIMGIRVLTIPVEDFFYSFAMISGWLIIYNMLNERDRKIKFKTIDQGKT
ncbi:MAG TPA: lycopene cyclase domain-containing protein [Ignavibacteria bacterium]|nr:lycopene cyclase domain-containing protein [Ignavibacteria bacterium]HMR40737.1 lycopene cyclase domain-containing protein [Ignavibacteria bacterium]